MYFALGYFEKIGGKSAKVCGTSLAFEAGLTPEQVRILGRWRCAETARHYYNMSDRTILNITSTLSRATMSFVGDQPLRLNGTPADSMIKFGASAYCLHKDSVVQSGVTKATEKTDVQQMMAVKKTDHQLIVPVKEVQKMSAVRKGVQAASTQRGTSTVNPQQGAAGMAQRFQTASEQINRPILISTLMTGHYLDVIDLDDKGFPIISRANPNYPLPGEDEMEIISKDEFVLIIDG